MASTEAGFADLKLIPELMRALTAEGYTTPTPIQAQAIPGVLDGRDLLGIAQTGTGKTAAFALPILQRLFLDKRPAPRNGARALILSPTRELATQIADSFKAYGKFTGLTSGVIFGGVGYKPQISLLNRGVDVLVATPGRLIDLMQEGHAVLSATEILVLDEADQMMDLGFIRPLRQIIAKLSMKRQSLFFSATMPHEIGALAAELLRDPIKVSVAPVTKTADRVAQRVIHVEASKKKALLNELVADPSFSRVLVFTRTKRGADKVARNLEGVGVASAAIHGNKSQNQREAALDGFKGGRIRVLVATDIAARGIDVDLVTHVVNYELPNIPESYVHRIGRTARAGAEGIAISLCDGEERAYLRDIEKLTRQQIPAEDRRGDNSLEASAVSEPRQRDGRDGGRRGTPGGRGGNGSPGGRGANGGQRGGGHGRSGERSDERSAERHGERARPSGEARPNGGRPNGGRPQHAAAGASKPERRPYDPLNAHGRSEEHPRGEPRRSSAGESRGPSSGSTRSKFDEERAQHQARAGRESGPRGAGGGLAPRRPAGAGRPGQGSRPAHATGGGRPRGDR